MSDFLVSIIIPTYRRPKFLKRAIQSALNQTYKNIEVIVVSDNEVNSIDEELTEEIIREFTSYKLIYLPSNGNKGGCEARNKGLEIARGEYINFLDDDDVLLPSKIEKQVELIKNNNEKLAVVGCCAVIKNKFGKNVRIERPIFGDDILYSQLKHNICTTSLNLINRCICTKCGGFKYIESSQEHLFLINIFNEKATFDFVDEVLVEINHHSGPRISTNSKKPIGAIKLAKYVETYYDRYTLSQVNILKLSHNKNIVQAYCEVGNFKMAINEYFKRYSISYFNQGNFKLPLVILKTMILKWKEEFNL